MKTAAMLCLALAACSSLDPNVGPVRIEAPIAGDAGPDAEAPGFCSAVGEGDVCFARDIRPLMDRPGKGDPTGRGCKSCHYRTEASHNGIDLGGLDLTTLGSLRRGGGSSGAPIVVAGKPDESVLVQVLLGRYQYANRMPKNGSPFWSDADVQLVVDWIGQGARGRSDE